MNKKKFKTVSLPAREYELAEQLAKKQMRSLSNYLQVLINKEYEAVKIIVVLALLLFASCSNAQDYKDDNGLLPIERLTSELIGSHGEAKTDAYCLDYGAVLLKTYTAGKRNRFGTIVGVKVKVRNNSEVHRLILQNKDYKESTFGDEWSEFWYVFEK